MKSNIDSELDSSKPPPHTTHSSHTTHHTHHTPNTTHSSHTPHTTHVTHTSHHHTRHTLLTHSSHSSHTHTHTERTLLYGLPDLLTRAAEAELESFPPECGISHCSIVYVAQVRTANIQALLLELVYVYMPCVHSLATCSHYHMLRLRRLRTMWRP